MTTFIFRTIQITSAVVFVISQVYLKDIYNSRFLGGLTLLSLVGFALGTSYFIFKHNFRVKDLISIGIFVIAIAMGILANQPASKPIANAAEDTSVQRQAAELGAKLGKEVAEKKIEFQEAQKQISEQFAPDAPNNDSPPPQVVENKKLAERAFDLSLNTEDSQEEVVKFTVQTIPVKEFSWTCNEVGCSYADKEKVYTFSYTTRLLAVGLQAVSLGAILFITNRRRAGI